MDASPKGGRTRTPSNALSGLLQKVGRSASRGSRDDVSISGPNRASGSVSGSSATSPRSSTVMPSAAEVENRFSRVAHELQMPREAANKLSVENKWVLLQEHEAKRAAAHSADDPNDFVQRISTLLTSNALREGTAEVAVSVVLSSHAIAWLERFVAVGGVRILTRILQVLLQSAAAAQSTSSGGVIEENIADVAKSFKFFVDFDTGKDAIAQDPAVVQGLLASLQYVNLLTQTTIVQVLTAMVFHGEGQGHMVVLAGLEHATTHGAPYWTRIISMLDRENTDLRIAVLMLIQCVVSKSPEALKKRLSSMLAKTELPSILEALHASDDKDLVQLIDVLYHQTPSLRMTEAAYSGKKNDEATAFRYLYDALKASSPLSLASFFEILQCMQLLPKSGADGEAIWLKLSDLLRMCTETPIGGEVSQWFRSVLERALDEKGPSSSSSSLTNMQAAYESRIELLMRQVDDLQHKLSDVQQGGAPSSTSNSSAVLSPTLPPKPKLPPKPGHAETPVTIDVAVSPAGVVGDLSAAPTPPAPPIPSPPPGVDGADSGIGGPPPPPPPPGAPGMGPSTTKKKPVIKPSTKLRGLNWTAVGSAKVEGTVFEALDDMPIIDALPKSKLDALFAASIPETNTAAAASAQEDAAPREVMLLESKRCNSVAILLSSKFFRGVPFTQIRAALVACDDELFSLEALLVFVTPTKEEETILRAFDGDRRTLGKAERFFLELASIPRVQERVQVLIFMKSFEEKFSAARAQCDLVCRANVLKSSAFPKLIEVMLALGNYLNGGTFRGGAFGFRLSTAADFLVSKTNDLKLTVADILVQICNEKFANDFSPNWTADLEVFAQASDVNVQVLLSEVQALSRSFQQCQTELQNPVASLAGMDGLPAKLKPFVDHHVHEMQALDAQMRDAQASYVALAKYLGFETTLGESEELFGCVTKIVRLYQASDRKLKTQSKAPAAEKNALMSELKKRQSGKIAASDVNKK